jgi:hypothetical protein
MHALALPLPYFVFAVCSSVYDYNEYEYMKNMNRETKCAASKQQAASSAIQKVKIDSEFSVVVHIISFSLRSTCCTYQPDCYH